jgi:hypothetical protein
MKQSIRAVRGPKRSRCLLWPLPPMNNGNDQPDERSDHESNSPLPA